MARVAVTVVDSMEVASSLAEGPSRPVELLVSPSDAARASEVIEDRLL